MEFLNQLKMSDMKDLIKAAIQTLIELVLALIILLVSIVLVDTIGGLAAIIIAIAAMLIYNVFYFKKK